MLNLSKVMKILTWPLRRFVEGQRSRQRRIDLTVLWPAILEQAPDRDMAVAAFAHHVYHDPAWLSLNEAEIEDMLLALPTVSHSQRSGPNPSPGATTARTP